MEIANTSISKLHSAKYNPKNRTDKRSVNGLLRSIKKFGILSPILIDGDNVIVDGHRRLTCAKLLKIEKVPTVTIPSKIDKNIAFETINTTAKKISARDILFIYCNGGHVSVAAMRHITRLKEFLNDKQLKSLSNKNVSFRVLDYANNIQRYIHKPGEAMTVKIINWLANNNMAFRAKQAMTFHVNKDVFIKAIALNRPLEKTFK